MPDFLVFCAIVPKLMGAKVILHVQDTSPELLAVKAEGSKRDLILRVAALQEKISTAFANHVITVGKPFEEKLLERGLSPRKLTVVLNSADPGIFPPERRTEALDGPATAERPLVVMYHGTAAERNGLETAVRAYAQARARAPYLRFEIKGQGETIPEVERLAKELGVGDSVVITDPCPSAELIDFIMQGDVGIIPYRSDAFMDLVLPTKAYEFALLRRAMIASDTPAMRSMFRPESVALCEPGNVDSFAAAIVDLYEHPEKRRQLIENAAQDYAPKRWEIMSARYQSVLVALADGKPVPAAE
jgi:glycosyltransferase involved in cell wall biosynthesis